jgi:hypothetical protein
LPSISQSKLFASTFDSKKLFIIMMVLAVILFVDTEIGGISDMIPEKISSSIGIATFVGIWITFAVTQYYVLAYVKKNNKESRLKARSLNLMHSVVTITQFVLAGVIGLVILQMFVAREYNAAMLYVALFISYGLWIVTLGLLAKAFLSWYKHSNKNLMVLILAVSMVAYVINGVLGLVNYSNLLAQQKSVIRSTDVAVFPTFSLVTIGDIILFSYQISSGIAYVLSWVGTVLLLRPFINKLGKIKFWLIMAAAMLYYLITFPLFTLGYFNPSENVNAMTNMIITSGASILAGVIFGAAFLSVARTLQRGSAIRNNMMIAAYGFVLFYIAGSAMVSQAAYPPYGLVAVSFTGLSCYLIYSGFYFSAISVSQDMALRQTIRKSLMQQSKLLDHIGSAQMERELQGLVLTLAEKASNIMEEETGVEPPMTEGEMKDYMEIVISEMKQTRKVEKNGG